MGVPPNHPFSKDFPLYTIHIGVPPIYGTPHIVPLQGHSEVSIRAPGLERSGLCLDNS